MKFLARFPSDGIILVCLFILALAFPSAIGIWQMNIANSSYAKAMSLPTDSPVRTEALSSMRMLENKAYFYPQQPRLAWLSAREEMMSDPRAAARVLEAYSHIFSLDFMEQFLWGNAEWAAGNRDAAFEHWRNAGALKYFVEEGYRARFRDDWVQAEDYARIAVGIAPEDARSHFLLADVLISQGKGYDEALGELERAAQIVGDGNNEFLSTILSRQGELLANQEKYKPAIDYFNRARQIAPLDARPHTDYADTILKIDPTATTEARALLTQVVTGSPWYVDAYILLAEISEKDGDLAKTENWYMIGLDKNPNDARLLFPLGEFYARQNRSGEAKETLTLALKYETRPNVLLAISRALTQVNAK